MEFAARGPVGEMKSNRWRAFPLIRDLVTGRPPGNFEVKKDH